MDLHYSGAVRSAHDLGRIIGSGAWDDGKITSQLAAGIKTPQRHVRAEKYWFSLDEKHWQFAEVLARSLRTLGARI
jgi:hypothetical protein